MTMMMMIMTKNILPLITNSVTIVTHARTPKPNQQTSVATTSGGAKESISQIPPQATKIRDIF